MGKYTVKTTTVDVRWFFDVLYIEKYQNGPFYIDKI